MKNITAIILAAGYSKRMGCFKPLLELDGQPIITRSIDMFAASGIRDIRVVIGYQKEKLLPVLENLGVRTIINNSYATGMFSSVLAAIRSLEPGISSFFVLPADNPVVRPWTIQYLVENFTSNEGKILIPTFKGRAGHPPLIDSKFIGDILSYNGNEGLKGALKSNKDKTLSIPVPDENILFDMDEPKNYAEIQKRYKGHNIPSIQACEVMLKEVSRNARDRTSWV
ncbi:MAG: nucleotidyltransferase family protein [Dehalococcoidia bacterium]|jgi:CTP:molybdopterin cytidylyltransferase MocA